MDIDSLYRTHGSMVLRRAKKLLHNEEDARDVLQQIFASLVREPSRFRGESSIATYLYRATTSACLQLMRNRYTRTSLLATRVVPATTTACDGNAETLAMVRELVTTLPDELARTVIYYYVDGMTHEEIADQLGCSRRHVGNLIESARTLARKEAG